MGRKKVDMAKKYTKATFLIDGIFLLITVGLFSIFGKTIIHYLSEDKIITEEIYNSMYLLVAYIILDSINYIYIFIIGF